jgi:hypothetical protein
VIDVSDPALYRAALRALRQFRGESGREFRGRFIQVFLGMKFYQNQLPSMFSNQFVPTEILQTLLDDLYAKASRPLDDCVLMIFEQAYLARTGVTGRGNTTAQNTWRNNFNLQKGVGCYAPPQDLASNTFLDQSRRECRYLRPVSDGVLAGASCSLCVRGARYRNEDHRKWLRIDPRGGGYAVVDMMNTRNFGPYVAPHNMRIPILPLIIALYHDALPGLVSATRREVDLADFAADFNFSTSELQAYFDQSSTNIHNQGLQRDFPETTYTQSDEHPEPPVRARRATRGRVRAERPAVEPVLSGSSVPPPAINSGWESEQYVAAALREAGWVVHDVSRQQLGYDLLAKRGRETRYIDAKSSVGFCTPTLTTREWQQATSHGRLYVLAIVEHFNPTAPATIFWVPDPVNTCTARESMTVQHSIARSSWTFAVVALAEI